LKRGGSPPGQRPANRKSKLDRYKPVIDGLLAAGVWNAAVILRESQAYPQAHQIPARDSVTAQSNPTLLFFEVTVE
jgi:hypothetical protein